MAATVVHSSINLLGCLSSCTSHWQYTVHVLKKLFLNCVVSLLICHQEDQLSVSQT